MQKKMRRDLPITEVDRKAMRARMLHVLAVDGGWMRYKPLIKTVSNKGKHEINHVARMVRIMVETGEVERKGDGTWVRPFFYRLPLVLEASVESDSGTEDEVSKKRKSESRIEIG